jgi:polygalacturonase
MMWRKRMALNKRRGFAAAVALAFCVMAVKPLRADDDFPTFPLPQIPDRTVRLTDFGGVGDGKTFNTDAFNKALAALDKMGGGTLVVPKGIYLTLPLTLISHLNLHLDEGATIQFPTDLAAYTEMEPLAPRPQSLVNMDGGNASLFYADHLTDIAFTGTGTIDGGGSAWWKKKGKPATSAPATQDDDATNHVSTQPAKPLGYVGKIRGRPKMIILNDCRRIQIDGLTLANSPMWFFVPVHCTDVTIENVKVNSPQHSPNTDALDPTASTNVLIRNCDLDEGDDNVAVKAIGGTCSNIWIEGLHCKHGHGISIGSETYGGVHDVTVRNCTFDGGDNGIRIKSARDRGNQLSNFTYSNITMDNVTNPIVIDMYYSGGKTRVTKEVTPTTPFLSHVRISDVKITNSKNAGRILGLPEAPVTDIVLSNVSIEAKSPMVVNDVKGAVFDHVTIKIEQKGDAIVQNYADLTIKP